MESIKLKIKVPSGFGFWQRLSSWSAEGCFVLTAPFLGAFARREPASNLVSKGK